MQYVSHYSSPMGRILLSAGENGLTSLCFEGQRYIPSFLRDETEEKETPLLQRAKHWLDVYFSGKEPDFCVPLSFAGTAFQNEVWRILCSIPYGKTVSYGQIAGQIAEKRGIPRMSARAVGGAVGHNPISIIIPCHRVVGSKGNLTGYGGNLERKLELLKLEKADTEGFFFPKKGLCKDRKKRI